jgi:hypothetical protein
MHLLQTRQKSMPFAFIADTEEILPAKKPAFALFKIYKEFYTLWQAS